MRIAEATGVFITLLLVCGALACRSKARSHEAETRCLPMYRFLVPEEYVGWIRVDFNAKDSATLPVEGDYVVFKIPTDGYLRTPARYMCGWPRVRELTIARIIDI